MSSIVIYFAIEIFTPQMANISSDIDKHDGTGVYGAGHPKKYNHIGC